MKKGKKELHAQCVQLKPFIFIRRERGWDASSLPDCQKSKPCDEKCDEILRILVYMAQEFNMVHLGERIQIGKNWLNYEPFSLINRTTT
ncbi:hypothetical protein [Sporosarcina ureae]|uniref:hypothetical protein n=1 Tax=Sporosarcina ureae TaxID=1571 RepID=UPI0026F2432F|nr:hypothetical protein [Sporosarcina ureae]